MIDREKVITGLGDIKTAILSAICFGDGYGNEHYLNTLDDAMEPLEAGHSERRLSHNGDKRLAYYLRKRIARNH